MPPISQSAISLRNFQKTDVESLSLTSDNIGISQNLRDRFPSPYTMKDAEAFVDLQLAAPKTLNKVISLDGQLIGVIGIIPQEDVYRLSAEIGYWIAEEHWGKGFATAALKEMVLYAFSNFGINRLFACTFGNNHASMQVLLNTGFVLEGVHRKKIFKRNSFFDEHVFGLLRDEFGG